jgi:tRNA 5-methylaminomethyl-2-thiouridine biosynthesis bifunctional protein
MKPGPLRPARIVFPADGGPPEAPDFGDLYHPRVGALAQARHVFLAGNGLPARWAGRDDFTVLETGFGLGHNLLALWDAWRNDPQRPARLHVVSLELHPPTADDLARAHAASALPELAAALVAAWPPLAPGLHVLAFEGGRLRLTLGLGDATALLPQLRLQADALLLDGFAPDRNAALWSPPLFKAMARLAAPGCTAATWSVARAVHEGLRAAGFEVARAPGIGGKREITTAVFRPRVAPRGPVPLAVAPLERASGARPAVVVGAGVAGAACARALAEAGLRVQVLDAAPEPAAGASGNPAGLFHAIVNGEDGPYARLYRAAALRAAQVYAEALSGGRVAGQLGGLLRLASAGQTASGMQALLQRLGLPAAVAEALDAEAASARAGVPLATPAWHHPRGGWIAPRDWVREVLSHPGVAFRGGTAVASLQPAAGGGWRLCGAAGDVLAEAPLVVLANAEAAAALAPPLPAPWPLHRTRGQVSWWPVSPPPPLACALAGDGYALALPGRVLCGATQQRAGEPGHDEPAPREADHGFNRERFMRLTGLAAPDPAACEGRVGWRLASDDRLPVAGALPQAEPGLPRARLTQARAWPRHPGLFVLTALGSRGLTLAPLLGELVAAQALGLPWPLEQDLADAVDPARWAVRAVRHGPG